MQWNASNAQAGFSISKNTWLPVPANYKTINVETEHADPNSLLNWHTNLIVMRRRLPALRDGGIVFLDTANSNVLSYLRTAPAGAAPIIISLNMSAQPQTVTLDTSAAGVKSARVKTLIASDTSLKSVTTLNSITLPPYSSWVGEVQ